MHGVSHSRVFWVLLMLFGIIMEACGLYFQYSLSLNPCVKCVYERALIACFILAGFIGFVSPDMFITRALAILVFLASSGYGTWVAYNHNLEVYASDYQAKCSLVAHFPSMLPLDQWLPWMFSPTGACQDIYWSLFGFGIPEWVIAIFGCGCVVSLVMLLNEFFRIRTDYGSLYR